MTLVRPWLVPLLLFAGLSVWAPLAGAEANVELRVEGLDAAMSRNVESRVAGAWTLNPRLDSERRRQAFLASARSHASQALRPWGYYAPKIEARLERRDAEDAWRLRLDVQPGEPIRVADTSIRINGPGAGETDLEEWRKNWPLVTGTILNQVTWEEQKSHLLEIAQTLGYLQASFSASRIALNLESNQAGLELHLETGPRAVMGEVIYQQDVVDVDVLSPIGRFRPGDLYRADYIDDLRLDLWKTGYFSEIEVTEQHRESTVPLVVDLHVRLTGRHRATHQVTLGYGTDTQFRTQYNWTRHRLSHRGDSLSAALGWRQRYSEILASSEYRLPRRIDALQFWVVNGALRRENQDFFLQDSSGDDSTLIASGQVMDAQLKSGRLRFIDTSLSSDRIAETTFVAFLREKDDLEPLENSVRGVGQRDFLSDLLGQTVLTISVGMEWDWSVIRGRGFDTSGFHHRAWWFTANEAWGSEKDFSQVYLSSRWNGLIGERWKLLLRGEIGYSDGRLQTLGISPSREAVIAVSELPYRYSFRTGGSQSVRGYRYNRLSSNGIGSNHLLVGSAELEYRLRDDWSVAGFYDIGNAFNDWGKTDLKRGWGFGARWYSLIGSIRADLGRAEDIEGKPWEFYLTIGTPLL
jgi:translocation and assembly module TamA